MLATHVRDAGDTKKTIRGVPRCEWPWSAQEEPRRRAFLPFLLASPLVSALVSVIVEA